MNDNRSPVRFETTEKGNVFVERVLTCYAMIDDNYMEKIHKEYPEYNWGKNKGYPTKEHKLAIKKYGITKYHRKSFKLYDEQLKINF